MKITLAVEGEELPRCGELPYAQARHVIIDGACPNCKCVPLAVVGSARTWDHDTVSAKGVCTRCLKTAGKLVTIFDTVFGIEEDERVLNGPWKVF